MKKVLLIFVFLMAFFPAYFGYQPELQWIGLSITIVFGLSCYIPFLRDFKIRGIIGLLLLGMFGYLVESIGALTCFPYGCFSYSEQLGPKLFDLVPWMLFFTWPPLVVGVWSLLPVVILRSLRVQGMATKDLPGSSSPLSSPLSGGWRSKIFKRLPLKRLAGGLFLVFVDLILDPIAVMMGLWGYIGGGFWFGVPLSNFVGWLISGTIGIALLDLIMGNNSETKKKSQSYAMGLWLFLVFFAGYMCFRLVL